MSKSSAGDRLFYAREELLGLTQPQLARFCDYKSYQAIWNMERGKTVVNDRVINFLATCNINPEWIKTGEGSETLGPVRRDFAASAISELTEIDVEMFVECAREIADGLKERGAKASASSLLKGTVRYYNGKVKLLSAREDLKKSGKLVELRRDIVGFVSDEDDILSAVAE